MPSRVDERLRFIARLRDGDKMAGLCAEFGISRKTGYKIRDREERCGFEALTDRKRRPYRQANQLPPQVEAEIVRIKLDVPAGVRRRFASGSVAGSRACGVPPSARCTRCPTGVAW